MKYAEFCDCMRDLIIRERIALGIQDSRSQTAYPKTESHFVEEYRSLQELRGNELEIKNDLWRAVRKCTRLER